MRFAVRRAKQALLLVFCVAFATKSLIPLGYMPGAFADGGPVQLCPVGLPQGLLPGHAAHHGHGGEDKRHWEHCPFGGLSAAYAIPGHYHLELPFEQHDAIQVASVETVVTAPILGFRSRAPPHLPPIV